MYRPDEGDLVLVRLEDKFGMDHMTSGRHTGETDDSGEHFEIDLVDSPYVDKSTVMAHKEDLYENTKENQEKYF